MNYFIVCTALCFLSACVHQSISPREFITTERQPASEPYSSCAEFASSDLVKKISEYYQAAKDKGVSALGFRVYDFPVALVNDQRAPACVAVLDSGGVHVLATAEPLSGIYIFGARKPSSSLQNESEKVLEKSMVAAGYNSYLFYNLSNSSRDPFTEGVDVPRYHFQFFVHEGFHLFRQSSFWSADSKYWPKGPHFNWTSRDGKSFVNGTCYRKNLEVKYKVIKEIGALSDVFVTDVSQAKSRATEFLKTRAERWQMLRTAQVKLQGWSDPSSCNEGEEFLEWVEGSAEFVEFSYLLQLGLIQPGDIYFHQYFNASDEGFYRFGMLQLFLLQKTDPAFEQFVTGYLPSQGLRGVLIDRIKSLVQ